MVLLKLNASRVLASRETIPGMLLAVTKAICLAAIISLDALPHTYTLFSPDYVWHFQPFFFQQFLPPSPGFPVLPFIPASTSSKTPNWRDTDSLLFSTPHTRQDALWKGYPFLSFPSLAQKKASFNTWTKCIQSEVFVLCFGFALV